MRRALFASSLCLLILSCACRQTETYQRPTIPFVHSVLSGSFAYERAVVTDFSLSASEGALFLIGDQERCARLSESLVRSDRFDNVDGRDQQDGLPDFAGETICSIYDVANTPYRGYIGADNEEFLRELAVRGVLSAMDTLCFVSPYDRSGMGEKPVAKLVVLTSSYMAAFGQFDADTLLRALDCPLPVIAPVSSMLDEVFASEKTPAMIGFLAPKADIASGIYSALVQQKARSAGRPTPECVVFAPEAGEDPFQSFLDSYISAGYGQPLDVLIVDDLDVDMARLEESRGRVTSVMNEETLTYGKALAPDFRVLDVRSTLTSTCYRILRERNLFTHNIARPKTRAYMTCLKPDLPDTDAYRFGRASDASTDTYMLLQYSSRYFPQTQNTDVQN